MDWHDVVLYGALIVAVILHEISHGVVALAFGDDTAKRAGRLTLNPVPHIDPLGSIILPAMAVLGGFPALGWAKPVPVNPAKLRDPRRQMLFVGLVGPATNFALMLAGAIVARQLLASDRSAIEFLTVGDASDVAVTGFEVAFAFAVVNLFLGVFNMLPIPPLDGSSLIERVLPRQHLPAWHRFRPYGFLVLFLLLFWLDFFGVIIEPFEDALFEFIVT